MCEQKQADNHQPVFVVMSRYFASKKFSTRKGDGLGTRSLHQRLSPALPRFAVVIRTGFFP
jgi:hypothetical protein